MGRTRYFIINFNLIYFIFISNQILESLIGVNNLERGRWLKKSQLSESKRAINDVKFAPRNVGLKLATASADGSVRIYEASDPFSLSYWPLQVNFIISLFYYFIY